MIIIATLMCFIFVLKTAIQKNLSGYVRYIFFVQSF